MTEHKLGEMTANSSANSIILILVAFSDNLSAENSKLSAESGLPGLSLLGSMGGGVRGLSSPGLLKGPFIFLLTSLSALDF